MKVSLRLFGVPAVFCLGARSTDGRRLDDASNFDSDIRDRITQCQDDETDFSVKLMFDGGDWYNAKCARSYSRCPLEGGSTCLVGEEHWMAESGQTFEYLETRVFHVGHDGSPKLLWVNDDKGTHGCARAFRKDQYQDFYLGDILDLTPWWDGDPLQITIVPFNIGSGTCVTPSDSEFDAARAVAVWLSPYEGQSSDPGDGVYCDLSANPEDCLNMPYWEVDNDQLVLHGTLANVLRTNPSGVNVYVPEGYDVYLPINNYEVRFKISDGSIENCVQFLKDGSSTCEVDSATLASYPTDAKLTVSGLGRINGWFAMKWQFENNIRVNGGDEDIGKVNTNPDFSYWKGIAEWYIDAHLLSLASTSTSSIDGFAVDVSGVETAWGSKLGWSPIQLNGYYAPGLEKASYPAKVYDFKQAGFWNDQSDAVDLLSSWSYSNYLYLHVNDDAIKVAATDTYRENTTVLKGNAGCVVILGSYGNSGAGIGNIDNSVVDGVYVHRIVHSSGGYQGCAGDGGDGHGGVVCTRSCGQNRNGLVDATVSNLYIPEIGDANSVAQPFGIGVNEQGGYCDGVGVPANEVYPIRNLVFKDFNIYPNPSCMSNFYDDSGKVQWGWYGKDKHSGKDKKFWHSVTFYDPNPGRSDPSSCDFQGAVSFSSNPQYFVCGYPDDNDAINHCMTTDGIGSYPNINYDVGNTNTNIDFPVCGFAMDNDLLATV